MKHITLARAAFVAGCALAAFGQPLGAILAVAALAHEWALTAQAMAQAHAAALRAPPPDSPRLAALEASLTELRMRSDAAELAKAIGGRR